MLALSAVFFLLPLLTVTPPLVAAAAPVAALAVPALALRAAPAEAPDAAAKKSAEPGWWRDDVVYQIFVRSFADSDGDGVGDFAGLTARLDYLNDGDPKTDTDLGVDAIWLMPIHASPSYHGYDVLDYRSINPDYGTLDDFDRFVKEADRRGIRVIIDFVMNHSAKDHPWFKDAVTGPKAKHRDRYLWRESDPGWTQPWGDNAVWHQTPTGYYYGLFWGGMPDLNLGNAALKADLLDAMRFWLDRGVAGFRLDAIRHLFEGADGTLVDMPESHAFLRDVRAELTRTHPHVLLVGEAWTDTETIATYFGDGDEMHLAFGFQTAGSMIEAARDGVRSTFNQAQGTAAKAFTDRNFEAPFLANHDMPRTMRQLGGDAAAMRVAAAMLFAQPGTPFVYYGEEIGMQGGPSGKDEDKRTPMRWRFEGGHGTGPGFTTAAKPWHDAPEAMGVSVADQRGNAGTLWTLYRDLIALRHAHPALSDGAASQPVSTGGGRGFTTLLRTEVGGGERILAIYNVHTEASQPATVKVAGAPKVLMSEGLDGPLTREGEVLKVPPMKPRSFAFVRLD